MVEQLLTTFATIKSAKFGVEAMNPSTFRSIPLSHRYVFHCAITSLTITLLPYRNFTFKFAPGNMVRNIHPLLCREYAI
jgi:hypothetical protein